MVQFTKNGQGFWDFDFEVLAEQTSVEFAKEIKIELIGVDSIKDVQVVSQGQYFVVHIYKSFGVVICKFSQRTNKSLRHSFTYADVEAAYENGKKLGVIHG